MFSLPVDIFIMFFNLKWLRAGYLNTFLFFSEMADFGKKQPMSRNLLKMMFFHCFASCVFVCC